MQKRWWLNVEDNRFWKALLLLGIILHVIASFTSDLGLDAHIHSTYVTVEEGTGEASLDWGHTRTVDPKASDPSSGGDVADRYAVWHTMIKVSFMLLGTSEAALHIGSLMLTALTLVAVWWTTRDLFGKKEALCLTALVSIHPTFLYAAGRANVEEFMLLAMVGFTYGIIMLLRGRATLGISLLVLTAFLGVSAKGLPMLMLIGVVTVTIIAVATVRPMRIPHALSIGVGISVVLFLIGILTSSSGTFVAVQEVPHRYLSAVLISTFDVIVVYALFGMILWPFIKRDLFAMKDHEATLNAGMIGLAAAGITLYVAAQWTTYSLAWDAEWPWSTWTMGNNGRYGSMLMVPAFWLIMRLRQISDSDIPSLEAPGPQAKMLAVGIALILPISMLVAIHGQTIWTEDAAELIGDNMEDSEDFLFVSDATMGMHWLYTFHLEVDPYDDRQITGHWRAPDSGWEQELSTGIVMENRGNLSTVEWVILAPGIEWEDAPPGWYRTAIGDVDFMNGGGQWEMWSTHSELLIE